MALTAKQSQGDFELAPEGTFFARCFQVIDMGLQKTSWQGQDKYQHKVVIGFELPTELMKDGCPFMVSSRYTLSLSPKSNLYSDLISWRGKAFTTEELMGFDLFNVLGAPCMLTVVHNSDGEKTYANIASITSLPKGMTQEDPVNPPVKYSLEEDSDESFNALPEWIQKKITRPGEMQGSEPASEQLPEGALEDDDIPFMRLGREYMI